MSSRGLEAPRRGIFKLNRGFNPIPPGVIGSGVVSVGAGTVELMLSSFVNGAAELVVLEVGVGCGASVSSGPASTPDDEGAYTREADPPNQEEIPLPTEPERGGVALASKALAEGEGVIMTVGWLFRRVSIGSDDVGCIASCIRGGSGTDGGCAIVVVVIVDVGIVGADTFEVAGTSSDAVDEFQPNQLLRLPGLEETPATGAFSATSASRLASRNAGIDTALDGPAPGVESQSSTLAFLIDSVSAESDPSCTVATLVSDTAS